MTGFKVIDNIYTSNEKAFEQDAVVKRILKDLACPDSFKHWLRQLYHAQPVEASWITNMTFPQVVLPSNASLKTVAERYLKKYGINILICTTEEFEEFIASNPAFDHPIGVIVTADHEIDHGFYYYKSFESTQHVTPVLLHFSKEGQQAIILDSVGVKPDGIPVHPLSEFVECTLNHLTEGRCETCVVGAVRQADFHSCRSDALIILRNALVDLKRREANVKKRIPLQGDRLVSIPLAWDYTSQISQNLTELSMGCEQESMVTLCGRTMEEFKAHYVTPVTFKLELLLPRSISFPDQIPELPQHYSVFYKEERMMLEMLQTKKVNNYLRSKGFELFVVEK